MVLAADWAGLGSAGICLIFGDVSGVRCPRRLTGTAEDVPALTSQRQHWFNLALFECESRAFYSHRLVTVGLVR